MAPKIIFDYTAKYLSKVWDSLDKPRRVKSNKELLIESLWVGLAFAIVTIIVALCGVGKANAADTVGPTYPITEPDMLEEMQAKLTAMEKSGRLKALQSEAIKRSQDHIESPSPVKGLIRTKDARTYQFDPSYIVPSTITTPSGQLIGQAGQRINPLDYVPLSKHLIFFDGNDKEQVSMAVGIMKRYQGRVKPILVAGKPFELTRAWKQQVYFDQGGSLVRRFGIHQVPALVSQEDKHLRIDELEVTP